jgi:hypothetical protein
VVHPLKVSLEELYNGASKKLSLSRNLLCLKCNGYVIHLLLCQLCIICPVVDSDATWACFLTARAQSPEHHRGVLVAKALVLRSKSGSWDLE